jgi:predicted RNase H-like HicB family nuclease
MSIRYELIIYWSEPDQSFVVEVPELPGCMADGATYEEAVANAKTVIAEWIETAQELGREVPEPKGRLGYARDLTSGSPHLQF